MADYNGHGSMSHFSGPGGGSNYALRSVPGTNTQGNWNTGGPLTGAQGSFQNGGYTQSVHPTQPGYVKPQQQQQAPVMAPPVQQVPIPRQNPFSWLNNYNTQPQPLLGRVQSGWPGYVPGTQQADPTPYPGGVQPTAQQLRDAQVGQNSGFPSPTGNTVYKNQNFPGLNGPGGPNGGYGRGNPSH